MDIDLKGRTVTFRVLYAGPEGATKFRNLRELHETAPAEERAPFAVLLVEPDRVVTFPFCPQEEPPLLGFKVVFQAMAAPGRVEARAVERLLLLAADAIVFLPDRKRPASKETRRAFAGLVASLRGTGRDLAEVPILVEDYVDGEPRLALAHLGESVARGLDVRLLPVEGDTQDAVKHVFESARTTILERYRRLEKELPQEEARAALRRAVGTFTVPKTGRRMPLRILAAVALVALLGAAFALVRCL